MVSVDALYSPDWFRVSKLVLRLKPTVRIGRQQVRGEVWYVYRDEAFGRQMRLNLPAHRFAGRLDGRQPVETLWNRLFAEAGDAVPSQHEIVDLVQQLADAGLVALDPGADLSRLSRREAERRRSGLLTAVNPLSFKVPLLDPGPLLERTWRLAAPLYTGRALLACVAVLAFAGLVALEQAEALVDYATGHVPTPGFAFAVWLMYPLLKAVHELAHAWAVRTWGGRVREVGVTVMMGMPVPYVDASAAALFASRRQRIAVSLAGIVAELLVAAAALWLWLSVADGAVRTAAFAAMTIGAVSTVFVNGNPLMRFDAYFALSDALGLPNLAERSRAAWIALARRVVAGERDAPLPGGGRERAWLLGWGLASWVYRVLVFAWLASWVAPYSRPAALALLAWGGWLVVGRAAWSAVGYARRARWRAARPVRALGGIAVALAAVVGLLTAVPLPDAMTLPGVVMPADAAKVRSAEPGRVVEVLVAPGQRVTAGTPLARMESLALSTELARLQAQLEAQQAERIRNLESDRAAAGVALDEIERLRTRHAEFERRLASLDIRAAADGTVTFVDADGPLERHVRQGEVLMYVLQPGSMRIQTLARDDEAQRLKAAMRAGDTVEARLADHPGRRIDVRLASQTPQAVHGLPGAALSDRAGGSIPTDPADRDGLRTLEPWFQLDFLPEAPLSRIGASASVRVLLPSRPGAEQAGEALRRLFLRRLDG